LLHRTAKTIKPTDSMQGVHILFLSLLLLSLHERNAFQCRNRALPTASSRIEKRTAIDTKKEYDTLATQEEPKRTWETVALADARETVETFELSARNINTISESASSKEKLDALSSLRGTYYINGLASCLIGKVLISPFEAHGFIKSITFHGNGSATFRSRYVSTPVTSMERRLQTPFSRGVMSRVFDTPFKFLNAFLSQERNTANLACRLWPPNTPQNFDKLKKLVVGGDNAASFVLDPETLATLGPLTDVDSSFADLNGKKVLAHTR